MPDPWSVLLGLLWLTWAFGCACLLMALVRHHRG